MKGLKFVQCVIVLKYNSVKVLKYNNGTIKKRSSN